ncbi:unnamed protein product [Cylindrotheca closterium]|uniref:fructose-bisphosphate aldolase n=1 Tax=Cylindrotheca closterium TaxID=2856 RepID=A0AAD2GAJ1_9STRA|nr:unnamed protein product [Cylindrotheca closterium]CAJ1967940.1 unnamed protein product [Cylindrotheca closterium]
MRDQLLHGHGFLAALDQSGGSTPSALQNYQYPSDLYQGNEASMFEAVHGMRCRIMQSPVFLSPQESAGGVLGAILFEDTLHRTVEGQQTAQYLWNTKQIIPFLKIDQGLLPKVAGVQLMKPFEESPPAPSAPYSSSSLVSLEEKLQTARNMGVFGTKMRSVIHENNPKGIKVVVEQQFDYGKRILKAGLVPILEPEVNIESAEKQECEETLKKCLLQALDQLQEESSGGDENISQVILKLSIPCQDNFYQECMDHPACLKVVALSGGYSQAEANSRLSKQPKMIASFSRALSEGLTHNLSDEEFNKVLEASIASIVQASV